jgi:hypothetical protein
MRRIPFLVFFLALTLSLSAPLTPATSGKDHFLVVAGGHEAAKNQVSLEKNVLFFRKVLQKTAPDAELTEYFSSGNTDIRSVQFESANGDVPPANRYMAQLFASTRYLNLQYRRHTLGEVDGITSPANLNRWFDGHKGKLESGDRLILYVTAHGGRSADKKKPENTRIHLWQRQTFDVLGLQANLKKLPDDVAVILVMAQCYSGGFSHAIFNETNPDSGEFDQPVCGFFATVSSRESAGCTADINEENYDEFSSHFWAAIRGETRMGKRVGKRDFDGNGEISFNEAYAYTILTSKNIDIPMKTSGAFLRERSRFRDEKEKEKDAQLLTKHTPYSKTIQLADPVEQAILEGLSKQLGLSGDSRYAIAEKNAAEIEKKRADLLSHFNDKKKISDGHRSAIRDTLLGHWPELSNLLTEQSVSLVSEASNEFVKAVEGHPRFNAWNKIEKERQQIADERFVLEKEWARYIRFLRAHNNVVLAENLRILGNDADLSRFQAIRLAESQGIELANAPTDLSQ